MADNPQTPSEVSDEDAKWWLAEIEAAKDRNKPWYDAAEAAETEYKAGSETAKEKSFGGLNIFWANVETQKAAIDDDFGSPQVRRLNAQPGDGLARHISQVWEQLIDGSVREAGDDHQLALAVHDTFLPGLGQVRVDLTHEEDDAGQVSWVDAPIRRVQYKDYLEGPGKCFADLPWVAFGDLYTLDDLVREFPARFEDIEAAKAVPRNYQLEMPKQFANDDERKNQFSRARIWEIWAKLPTKRRIYVAEGYDTALKVTPDPFRLKKFFPCPRPMLANGDEGWQKPITDYSRYRDQADELDRICHRIYNLTETLKRRGVKDKDMPELDGLAHCGDNVFIAVDMTKLDAKGGLKSAFETEDLVPTIQVLKELHIQRDALIRIIYELAGISDLARGQTDPRETLGAQKLKKTFGSSRFDMREERSREFAAEAYGIKGELLAEHCPRGQIEEVSGIALPTKDERRQARDQLQRMQQIAQKAQQAGQPLPPFDEDQMEALQRKAKPRYTWEQTAEVLRSDRRRCYMVQVETDQTAFVDEEADKKARIEFSSVLNQLMQTFGPMIAGNPANGEVFKQIILFVLSSFRVGRSMEEGIEEAVDNAIRQASQQKGQPDPKAQAEQAKAQSELQKAQLAVQKAQLDAQKAQIDLQIAQQKAGVEAQAKSADIQRKAVEGQQKLQQTAMQNEAKRTGHQIDMQNKIEQLQFEREQRASAEEVYKRDKPQNGGGE